MKDLKIPKGHQECETCEGAGEATFSCCSGEVVHDDIKMCHECYEHLGESECHDCDGKGYTPEDKTEFTDSAPSLQLAAEAYHESQKYGDL